MPITRITTATVVNGLRIVSFSPKYFAGISYKCADVVITYAAFRCGHVVVPPVGK